MIFILDYEQKFKSSSYVLEINNDNPRDFGIGEEDGNLSLSQTRSKKSWKQIQALMEQVEVKSRIR